MEWVETPESSNIARFKYESATNILYVEFLNGGSYQYFDVTIAVYEGMMAAPSKGQYFAQSIKGVYRYARL